MFVAGVLPTLEMGCMFAFSTESVRIHGEQGRAQNIATKAVYSK